MRWAALGLLVCMILVPETSHAQGSFVTLEQRAEGVRASKSFLFIVDQSGSMDGDRCERAIEVTLMAAQQPVDDMEACLIGFTASSLKWKQGWRKLPSKTVVDDMSLWIRQFTSNYAATRLTPALKAALKEEKKELTIVIVSDGEFYSESRDLLLSVLEAGQKEREKKKLPRAMVMTMAVGTKSNATKLRALGKAGKGGCYLWTTTKPAQKPQSNPSAKASKPSGKSSTPPK